MGSSGHGRSKVEIPKSKSGQRSRTACSNASDNMNRSPMMARLRGMSGPAARLCETTPDRPHASAGLLIEIEYPIVDGCELAYRFDCWPEIGLDPLRHARCHIGVDLLLNGSHHRRSCGSGLFACQRTDL